MELERLQASRQLHALGVRAVKVGERLASSKSIARADLLEAMKIVGDFVHIIFGEQSKCQPKH
jgi:hypothetical protein